MLKTDRTLLVASITSDLISRAKEAEEQGADAVELRIDLYKGDALHDLKRYRSKGGGLPVIVTNRPKDQGGVFEGSEDERLNVLEEAIEYADAVDIEITADRKDELVKRAKDNDVTVIVSYHDFERTPSLDEMSEIIKRGLDLGDVAKVAVTPDDQEDVFRVIELTLKHKDDPICTISMGPLGAYSRVVTPFYGSRIAYVSLGEERTAPGQMTLERTGGLLNELDSENKPI